MPQSTPLLGGARSPALPLGRWIGLGLPLKWIAVARDLFGLDTN